MRWEVWGWVMVTGLHTVSIHHLHHHTAITPELWPRPSFIYTFSETGAPWLQYIIFILSPWPLVAPVSRGQRLATVMSWVGSGPGLCWGKQSIHYLVCHYCHSPRHQPQQQTSSPGPLLILLLTLLIKHFLFINTSVGSMVLLFMDSKWCSFRSLLLKCSPMAAK